jgi:hypothetical protein
MLGLVLLTSQVFADDTGTSTVSVTVGAEADFVSVGNATLINGGSVFGNFTGTSSFVHKVRTTTSGGSGSITLQITSDFSGTGAPVANNIMTYTCTVDSPGTACSGSQTALTASATGVATFGQDAHSSDSGDNGSVAWTLVNKPTYKTGSYSATITFTITST